MKALILIISILLTGANALSADQPSVYLGKSVIPELGVIHFPPGEWRLEYRKVHVTPVPNERDYFVFKKTTGIPERVTIIRYPKSVLSPLYNFIDGIVGGLGDGIPTEERHPDPTDEVGTGNFASPLPRPDAKYFAVSCIFVPPPPEQPWLCHAYLFRRDEQAYTVAYASQTVTDPLSVWDIVHPIELDAAAQ